MSNFDDADRVYPFAGILQRDEQGRVTTVTCPSHANDDGSPKVAEVTIHRQPNNTWDIECWHCNPRPHADQPDNPRPCPSQGICYHAFVAVRKAVLDKGRKGQVCFYGTAEKAQNASTRNPGARWWKLTKQQAVMFPVYFPPIQNAQRPPQAPDEETPQPAAGCPDCSGPIATEHNPQTKQSYVACTAGDGFGCGWGRQGIPEKAKPKARKKKKPPYKP